ncbi:hypothetical protein BGW80DRAFT_1292963 [Lactifluus volemus]|nr:hypothetical protein BGW80DRAFT_1292963 [Lactifluus volemus]
MSWDALKSEEVPRVAPRAVLKQISLLLSHLYSEVHSVFQNTKENKGTHGRQRMKTASQAVVEDVHKID